MPSQRSALKQHMSKYRMILSSSSFAAGGQQAGCQDATELPDDSASVLSMTLRGTVRNEKTLRTGKAFALPWRR